jgi:hypothetical protein
MNEWFKANLLILNLHKTYFMQYSTKNSNVMNMSVMCRNSQIATSTDIKFLGLIIDNTLRTHWLAHVQIELGFLCSWTY